jgi:hypothetical protein
VDIKRTFQWCRGRRALKHNLDFPELGWVVDDEPLWLTDRLFFSTQNQHYDQYEMLVPYSSRIKESITVPGLIIAARSGLQTLNQYISTRSATLGNDWRDDGPCYESSDDDTSVDDTSSDGTPDNSCENIDAWHNNIQGSIVNRLLEIALSRSIDVADVEALRCLLRFGVDPNVKRLSGGGYCLSRLWHPIIRAARLWDITGLKILVDRGADINAFNTLQAAVSRPIHISHKSESNIESARRAEVIKFILQTGFDIRKYGAQAIVAAVTPNLERPDEFLPDADLCEILTSSGVFLRDIRIQDELYLRHDEPVVLCTEPETNHIPTVGLLQWVIRRGCNLETVRFLINQGLEVHSTPSGKYGNTMLHDALCGTSRDRSAIVSLLLSHGVECNVNNTRGESLLEACVRSTPLWDKKEGEQYFNTFNNLLSHGALIDGSSLAPILQLLIEVRASNSLIHEVLHAGANINAQHHVKYGLTPLQQAVSSHRVSVAIELMNLGADVNEPAYHDGGSTALQAACLPNPLYNADTPLSFIRYLIEKGADINAPAAEIDGATALQGAAIRGSLNVACVLLDYGADVNTVSANSVLLSLKVGSALDYAAAGGALDMVQLLKDAGGRSAHPGSSGFDGAMLIAKSYQHFGIVEFLEEHVQSG